MAVESLVESTSAAQWVAERNGDGLEGLQKSRGVRSALRGRVLRERGCSGKRGSCKQSATGLVGSQERVNGEWKDSENFLPESQSIVATRLPCFCRSVADTNADGLEGKELRCVCQVV